MNKPFVLLSRFFAALVVIAFAGSALADVVLFDVNSDAHQTADGATELFVDNTNTSTTATATDPSGIKITVTSDAVLNSRTRDKTSSAVDMDLYNDFLFSSAKQPFTVTLDNLSTNTLYRLTVHSIDPHMDQSAGVWTMKDGNNNTLFSASHTPTFKDPATWSFNQYFNPGTSTVEMTAALGSKTYTMFNGLELQVVRTLAEGSTAYNWSSGRAGWLADGKWVKNDGTSGTPQAGDVCYVASTDATAMNKAYWVETAATEFPATLIMGKGSRLIVNTSTSANDLILDGCYMHHGVSNSTFTLGGNLTVLSNSSLDIDDENTRTLQISAAMSGTGNLNVAGRGVANSILVLTNSNANYSGKITINKATLKLSESGALGTGTVVDNGTLEFAHDSTQTFSNVISGTGTLSKTGSGTLTLSGTNTYTGGTTISGGTLILSGGNARVGTGSLDISSTSQLTLSGPNYGLHYVSSLTGSGPISVTATSRFDLASSAAQTYSGTISIAANQSLHVGYTISGDKSSDVNLPNATVSLASGANLGLIHQSTSSKQSNLVIGTLNGVSDSVVRASGSVNASGTKYATLTVGKGDFAGVIGGSNTSHNKMRLIKNTDGTLTLSGINTYIGGTDIQAGTIVLSGAGTLGTGAVTLSSGALEFNNSTANINATISGSGDIAVSSGTASLLKAVTQTGGSTTLADGTTLKIGNDSTTVNATLHNLSNSDENAQGTVTVSGKLTLDNDQTTKFAGSIKAGSIEKTGDGVLQLYAAGEGLVNASSFVVSSGRLDMKEYFTGALEVGLADASESTAIFSPGNSVGSLEITGSFKLNPGATLLMEFDETGADSLVVNGNATFEDESIITVALSEDASPVPGQQLTIQLPAGIDFDNVILSYPSYLTNPVYNPANGVLSTSIDANAVPEPSTWALLVLGVAGLLYWRKRS